MQNKHYLAFYRQKLGAARRGIEWKLTFDQWLEFWGDDISRRGSGRDNLQMQRFADTGPYAIGNIRKGTPKQNSKTAGAMKRLRLVKACQYDAERRKDAMMYLPSSPAYDDTEPSGIAEEFAKKLGIKTHDINNKFM